MFWYILIGLISAYVIGVIVDLVLLKMYNNQEPSPDMKMSLCEALSMAVTSWYMFILMDKSPSTFEEIEEQFKATWQGSFYDSCNKWFRGE